MRRRRGPRTHRSRLNGVRRRRYRRRLPAARVLLVGPSVQQLADRVDVEQRHIELLEVVVDVADVLADVDELAGGHQSELERRVRRRRRVVHRFDLEGDLAVLGAHTEEVARAVGGAVPGVAGGTSGVRGVGLRV